MENIEDSNPTQQKNGIGEEKATVFSPHTSSIKVVVSDDQLSCWITIGRTPEGKMPEVSAVQQVLSENDISPKAIKVDVLENIYDKSLFDQKFLVAEGKPWKDAKKGRISYKFKTDISEALEEDETGRIDFKETGLIQQVQEGDVLAEVFQPVKGEDGLAVTGKPLEVKKYEPVKMPVGKNTDVSPKNANQVIASIDGLVSLRKDKVNVDPVLVVDGDVDYSSGNIDFKGAVMIKGGVKAGFEIKSESDVTIKEVVEDALIETEGNVILKSGFVGKGEGKIIAGGDVILPFSENQSIVSGSDILVSDVLLHCNVEADGKVIVSGKKGVLGGSIAANNSIEAQSAGSQAFTKTKMSIILKRETREKIEQHKIDVQNHKANTVKVDAVFKKLEQLKRLKRKLPPNEKAQYVKIETLKKKLDEEKVTLEETKKKLDEEYSQFENAYIKVKNEVFPGVSIEIGNARLTVREPMTNVAFKLKAGEISTFKPAK